jgi:hypothetical protein
MDGRRGLELAAAPLGLESKGPKQLSLSREEGLCKQFKGQTPGLEKTPSNAAKRDSIKQKPTWGKKSHNMMAKPT